MNENIFNGIADIYDKYRPSYPQALFTYLSSDIGLNSQSVIADIGAGTGILTKKLLNICNRVYAIEPNNDMRKVAEDNFVSTENFISINGTAENTTLCDHCVDYITAAQSFHWFDRQLFKIECKRILKNKGRVILIWNCRREDDEIVQKIDSISKTFCPDFSGALCGMRGEKVIGDYNNFFVGNYEIKSFYNPITFNKERFLGLHRSASYCPHTNEKNYINYINTLSQFFDKNCLNNELILKNDTHFYVGYI